MVNFLIKEAAHLVFNITEVTHHTPVIELCGGELNLKNPIVTVGVGALAIVVHEAMTVAKVEFLNDLVFHKWLSLNTGTPIGHHHGSGLGAGSDQVNNISRDFLRPGFFFQRYVVSQSLCLL
jgi:hypothetical protein